jgi:4-amino-4-deoxy-L-arabinose transferase-like glycosyltransferase
MTAQSRKDLVGATGLFVVGQLIVGVLFSLPFGPVEGGDTYMSIAEGFPDLSGSEWGYGGYVAVLAFGQFLGSGPWFTFFLQSIAVIVAGSVLVDLGRRFAGGLAGWFAAAFYLLYPLLTQWSRYLLTESLFYAGVVITTGCLVRAVEEDRPRWWPLWVCATATATLRPNGIILIGSVTSVLALSCIRKSALRLLAVTAVWIAVLIGVLVSPTLTTGSPENGFGPRTWAGDVVWNVPEERISMPQPINQDPSNAAFVNYVLSHPVEMADLGARRVWWELKQVRPWYSRSLNAFTATTMTVFYLLTAIGAWTSRRSSITLVVASITLPFMALIAVTWAIWEGRFGWWFLVIWTVWAGIGAHRLVGHRLSSTPPPTTQTST